MICQWLYVEFFELYLEKKGNAISKKTNLHLNVTVMFFIKIISEESGIDSLAWQE